MSLSPGGAKVYRRDAYIGEGAERPSRIAAFLGGWVSMGNTGMVVYVVLCEKRRNVFGFSLSC